MNHVSTMLVLRDSLADLGRVQNLIEMGRIFGSIHGIDQEMQLEMDRKQTHVDDKRQKITETMMFIASQN